MQHIRLINNEDKLVEAWERVEQPTVVVAVVAVVVVLAVVVVVVVVAP